MKLGIFDPYLDTIGGGERYCLSLAEIFLKEGYLVDVFWKDSLLKEKLIQRFGLDIEKINFVDYSPRKKSLIKRRNFENKYDFLFYFSDGSLPFMFGKKNFLHFQVPFKNIIKNSIIDNLKLKKINKIICNSFFTKGFIDESLNLSSTVVYPPVDINPIKPLPKENIIISVGRFSQLLQGKRQDVLVEAFKRLTKEELSRGWRLLLVGGSDVGGKDFVANLKNKSNGYPIEIIENPSFRELLKIYGKAKIFWTASGYGMDERKNPEKVEHFGMTTVEAMAAGCVPIAMGKGGQKEIINEGVDGFLWTKEDKLLESTIKLMKNGNLLKNMSEKAIEKSGQFSKEEFRQKILKFL